MSRLAAVLITALVLGAGCASPPAPERVDDLLIPAGHGHWVRIDEELDVETIARQRLLLPYGPPLGAGGARNEVPGAAPAAGEGTDLIAYQIAAIAHPLEHDERCQLEVVGLVLVHRDGRNQELPAHGYVLDNSDGRRGFRLEASPVERTRVVIPAHATATVVFTADVRRAPAPAPDQSR
jgi:hypothetical protein